IFTQDINYFLYSNQADTKNLIFSKLQRGLQKIISKNLITSSKNALQVIEAFNLENIWNDFGLSKDEMKPRHFLQQQLMIFPIFFVLMTKNSKEAYKELLQYIQENIFDMDPSKCVTDSEQGFIFAKLLGELSSRNASLLYHKVLALPLLPPDLIKNSFKDIKSQIFLMDNNNTFLPFLKYFENQWVGCKNFSVYNENIRTTSAVEAYNGIIGRSAEKNGHFFKFVKVIRDEEFLKAVILK
ncbi:hypothetical protein CVS40_11230, partial [Lucilia cuprina]